MTPAPSAGGEDVRKKRKRRKSSSSSRRPHTSSKNSKSRQQYAKRVDEISAGGLVIDSAGKNGLLIGRLDVKDQNRERLLWSLPKGHIESGESPEEAAIREVHEETGIECKIHRALGVIDFWFMAGGKRIHKTVHHFVFKETGGRITPQVSEVDDVRWFPLEEIVTRLAYPDERKLIARSQELLI